ncbi:undecaprenyl-phosphate alpha-N-acetylglucosaminyl 1-phosphate transferase [Flavilitoribacter nigricans DSM 23189 = NBRC 102662]|uniref:Undecaprenyl-phosphate alpha-N-acetylglucosaminyl 1-phosphate transferase n=2 Tax=Flavilitoribacter TaxID=2762562 RepID=A0A2D0NBT7_FLAN2|nr:undecaprenyl-phosphate alpha-N-acetylglucosaminyl 1-phosphate transferase [Flavilitoribacter nigricans DSM 23189 = NBRC 102662]
MFSVIFAFVTAFIVTYFAIPSIINIAEKKNLFDVPNQRSSHTRKTPSLGGIGIFAGAIFSIVFWTPFQAFGSLQFILCGFIILFLVGAKDDVLPMDPYKKMIAQFLAAAIIVFKTEVRISSLYGLFGVTAPMPEWLVIPISIFTVLVIINAFNLIDGIDGLAGSLGVIICGTLGCWFFVAGNWDLATVAFATVGAIVAFLRYNFSPAKIFMGDTGSLMIGLASAVLVLSFIELNSKLPVGTPYKLNDVPVVGIGIMIIPLFDTLRVFITRIIRGNSPFKADRRHIHHLLIDYGFSHMKATGILVSVNVFFITIVLGLQDVLDIHLLLLLVILIATGLTYFLHKANLEKKQQRDNDKPA